MNTGFICQFSMPFCSPYYLISSDHEFINVCCSIYGDYCKLITTDISLCSDCIIVKAEPNPQTQIFDFYIYLPPIICVDNMIESDYDEKIQTDRPFKTLETIARQKTITNNKLIVPIHAGGVSIGNRAYLFVGHTGVGKSTLISYLTSRGLTYLSDDRMFLEVSNKDGLILAHPYSKPIHLREQGKQILDMKYRKLSETGCEFDLSKTQYIDYPPITRYVYMPTNTSTDAKSVEAIYFISRGAGNQIDSHPIQTTDAVRLILEAQMWNNSENLDYFKQVIQIAKGHCWNIQYKDMDWVYDTITSQN